MRSLLKAFRPKDTDEYVERVAWICVRENDKSRKEVLFVRSPSGDRFVIPGGRIQIDQDPRQTLIQKIKFDLNVDLVPESIQLFTSFRAVAYGKPEGSMVENKYFVAEYLGFIAPTPQIYFIQWLTYDTEEELTQADIALLTQLHNEGILN